MEFSTALRASVTLTGAACRRDRENLIKCRSIYRRLGIPQEKVNETKAHSCDNSDCTPEVGESLLECYEIGQERRMSRLVLELRRRVRGDDSKSLDNISDESLRTGEEEGISVGIGEATVRLNMI
jgi:hypothetical protein